jgi:hypothetical protein
MWQILCIGRHVLVLAVVVAWATATAPAATAQSIALSLNLFHDDPLDDASGGTWQVAAKSADSFGIHSLDLKLTGIVAPASQPVGPRGIVNGSDPAGFSILDAYTGFLPPGVKGIATTQHEVVPVLLAGEEQSVFYGVGTVQSGQPGAVGPAFTTLANSQAIPWATGDPFGDAAWNTAAILAAGAFSAGSTPNFFDNGTTRTTGGVYISLGTSTVVGESMFIGSVTTIVRNNLGSSPDYNGNGIVDAADYTVWRDTLGQMGIGLAADGNRNGTVDQPDYDFWKANFGLLIPGAGSAANEASRAVLGPDSAISAVSVPEPALGTLLLGATGVLLLRRRFRHLRTAPLTVKKP